MKLISSLLAFLLFTLPALAQDLTVPSVVGIRGGFDVGWTGEVPGGVFEIRPIESDKRVGYGYANSNPTPLQAPEAPGDYRIVQIISGEIVGEAPLKVVMTEATLTGQQALNAGQSVGVTWDGPNNRGDFVTFATSGGATIRGASYAYVGNSKDGTVAVQAPQDAGSYDIVYVTGKTVLARLPVTVAAVTATLTGPQDLDAGQSVSIAWDGPNNRSDYVTFAERDGAPIRGAAYAYVGNSKDGTVAVQAPQDAGNYDIVYVTGDRVIGRLSVSVGGVSATLTGPQDLNAGQRVQIAWDGPNNRSDYVTFAERDGAPIRGAAYAYVGNGKDGTVAVQAPQDAGIYDIVYVTGDRVIGRLSVTVAAVTATLDAPAEIPAGALVTVAFDGPVNTSDLITFATRDGEPISPASYTYVGNSKDGTVRLRAFEELGPFDIVYTTGGRVIGRTAVEIVPVTMELSAPDEVQALLAFDVGWEGHGNTGDRINMVPADGVDVVAYGYIDPTEPVVRLTAPEAEGAYKLVYVTNGGKELARRAITVTPAPVDPGQLEVPAAQAFGPNDAVQVILDASGSMLQRQNGTRRIEIAKQTLTGLVTDTIPPGTGFALRVFGNREADACRTDLEIPLAPHDPGRATGVLSGITAVNLARTPIAQSVSLAAQDLANVTGQRVLIVITDGEETCEGDPAAAIEGLRALGWDIRVNIVGYAIDDAALARTFEAWAAAGGGAYYNAANGDELAAALSRAAAVPFVVRGPNGTVVATGFAGDPPMSLPAGAYVVQVGSAELPVTIASRELTRAVP